MYAQYGDAVAKPRMEWAMRQALASATGSRVDASKDRIQILNYGATEGVGVYARDFFAEERWNAKIYWRDQDRQWNAIVIVLPPEQLHSPASP